MLGWGGTLRTITSFTDRNRLHYETRAQTALTEDEKRLLLAEPEQSLHITRDYHSNVSLSYTCQQDGDAEISVGNTMTLLARRTQTRKQQFMLF